MEYIIAKYNYWIYIVLMMIGFYAMIAKKNLVKKLLGLNIFQWTIILFYISTSVKKGGATIPIIDKSIDITNTALYLNPLPHVLMLTAIVVGVSTTGVALALVVLLYRRFRTLDEDEIFEKIREMR
ncbi:MAG: cation:proton antiporter subunit C [Thermodesulfovibrionales bacterium]|nr:cation:proton antiporter subunit C [Thermodesulfovibrionales bacterium]